MCQRPPSRTNKFFNKRRCGKVKRFALSPPSKTSLSLLLNLESKGIRKEHTKIQNNLEKAKQARFITRWFSPQRSRADREVAKIRSQISQLVHSKNDSKVLNKSSTKIKINADLQQVQSFLDSAQSYNPKLAF